jgi:PAS domain S-box-containing protein
MREKPTYEEFEKRVEKLEREKLETERQRDEQLARADILQTQLNALTETAILVDPQGRILTINEVGAQRFGRSASEMIGTGLIDFFPPDLASYRRAWGEEVVRTGKPVRFQDERAGRSYDTHAYPVLDNEGRVKAVAVYARDITATLQVIQALLESEENFRSLAENANDGILIADGQGAHVYANRRASEMTGYTVDALLKTGLRELTHPDEVDGVLEHYEKRRRGEDLPRTYATRIVRKDGETVSVELTGSKTVWKGEPSDLVIMHDVTHRARMEQELIRSEERFRAIFEGSLDAIFLADPETGTILDANPAASELLLREPEEIVGLHYQAFLPSHWRERVGTAYEGVFEEEERTIALEAGVVRPDGSEVPVEVLAQLIQIDGVPVIHALVRDISDRKRMDQELRESEAQFRTLTEAALTGIFVFQDGKFAYVNPALARIFGYDVEEMIGKMGPLDLVLPEDRDAANAYARQCQSEREGDPSAFSFRAIHRSGNVINCEAIQAGVRYKESRAIIGTILDVTRRKRMEEELLKAQKLESLGVLAGGIAHDFNNILTAISTNISMARMYGELDDDLSQMMEDAEKASVRARSLTQQLLAFSRGGAPVRKSASIATILRENTEFALSGSNVRCESVIPKGLWQVEVDEGQIGQVIHNLVINAIQAMPEGGILRVGAENVSPDDLEDIPVHPGRYVKVSVSDQGIGIPGRHMNKIFDPFFTTKQKGSGLGLTSSFTIVKNHEGHIHVDSLVDRGTRVDVYLPASRQPPVDGEQEGLGIRRGEGRILLVDDEEMIRRAGREALTRLGYEVALASDGAEGSRLYEEAMLGGRPFDVVLLDLTIPGGTGGKDTVRDLLRIDPEAKVIASSGYSTDPVMADFRTYGFCEVMIKPYRIGDLGEVLHKVMHGSNQTSRPASSRTNPSGTARR